MKVGITITSADYFSSQYRDYEKQNPPKKLDHYLEVIEVHSEGGDLYLLDIGCGRGAFLERARLRHPQWSLHGTDINQQGLEATRVRVPDAVLTTASADIQSHRDKSVDVITAWDVIEHVESIDGVASSVESMLKPGGLFLFVVPVYDGVTGRIVKRLDKDPTHVHKRGRDFWLDWTAERFEILEWHGIFRYLVAGRWYAHLPTGRLRWASAILVACRKLNYQVS